MMDCEMVRMLLNQQQDGTELGEDVTSCLREHMAQCAECRETERTFNALREEYARLDDAVQVPEAFSSGWRQAVRHERAQSTRKRFSPRVLASVAAGIVLIVLGGTAGMNRMREADLPNALPGRSMGERQSYGVAYSGAAAENYSLMGVAAMDEATDEAMDTGGGGAVQEKRIKTASLNIKTGDFDKALETLRALAAQGQGYISDESLYGVAGEDARSAMLSVRVEANALDAFLDGAAALGQVQSRSVNVQDVTEYYTDVAGRLESAQARRQRLNELVAQAQDVSELIELEAALGEVQQTIEGYERTLTDMDTRITYATVNVNVNETLPEEAVREGELGLMARIRGALGDSLAGLADFAQGTVVFVIAALPWLAVAAGIALILYLIIKGRRAPKK